MMNRTKIVTEIISKENTITSSRNDGFKFYEKSANMF